jgi:hypothetical protein
MLLLLLLHALPPHDAVSNIHACNVLAAMHPPAGMVAAFSNYDYVLLLLLVLLLGQRWRSQYM